MKKSLKELMSGLIDYAGLFPPASLPLDKAIAEYLYYKKSEYSFPVSRFVVPASSVENLKSICKEHNVKNINLSVLLPEMGFDEKNEKNIFLAIDELSNIIKSNPFIEVSSYEIKLPKNLSVDTKENLLQSLTKIISKVNKVNESSVIFFEPFVLDDNWKNNIDIACDVILQNKEKTGFKLRTGGVTKDAFPHTDIVAYAIKKCSELKIKFKATAGLHHPLRHYNTTVNSKMHGFFNVFLGFLIAEKYSPTLEKIKGIINTESPDKFNFSDDFITFESFVLSLSDIKKIKASYQLSYGSCSIDEPIDDLKTLKLMK